MNKQQQMQEILRYTVDYYREDPEGRRAVANNGECVYTTDQGNHCAIGRHFRPEFQTTMFEQNADTNICMLDRELDYYLVSGVIGLGDDFWATLQEIHDRCTNWNKEGLTDAGKERYVAMQDRIARGEYDG